MCFQRFFMRILFNRFLRHVTWFLFFKMSQKVWKCTPNIKEPPSLIVVIKNYLINLRVSSDIKWTESCIVLLTGVYFLEWIIKSQAMIISNNFCWFSNNFADSATFFADSAIIVADSAIYLLIIVVFNWTVHLNKMRHASKNCHVIS